MTKDGAGYQYEQLTMGSLKLEKYNRDASSVLGADGERSREKLGGRLGRSMQDQSTEKDRSKKREEGRKQLHTARKKTEVYIP